MKFVVSSTLLSARLQTLGRVISSKNNMPILDCFIFTLHDGQLRVVAADSETLLSTEIELIECESNLSFAVNAKTIQEAMKEIPEQPLDFYINENSLEITVEYQNGKYNFMGQSAAEYPQFPALGSEFSQVTLQSAPTLLSNVSRALFATADDPIRPQMNGIFFDMEDEGLTIVASDGRKLACGTILGVKASTPGSFILPKKPATLLKGLLSKESGAVEVRFNQRNAEFQTPTYLMMCRLIEGRYPKYRSVIPQGNPNCATVNRAALLSALRRVLVFSNAASALVKLHLESSRLTISGQDIDFSQSAEESLLCEYSGMPLNIGFKGTILQELINNIEAEEITLQLADPARAGVIVPAQQPEGETILMLQMPMMLND
ncbi:MAG: DNA polymerase III subunit beta [Alloprevotella sp.]